MDSLFSKLTNASAVLLAALFMFSSCSSDDDAPEERISRAQPLRLSANERELINAQADFGFKMLSEISKDNQGKNFAISPFCIQQSLSMLANGVSDDDREKFISAFGINSIEEMNDLSVRLNDAVTRRDPDNVKIKIANSLWMNSVYRFNENFVDLLRSKFYCESKTYNFADVSTADIVNKWLSDKSGCNDMSIIPAEYNHDGSNPFILANALNLEATWKTPFDKSKTKMSPFTDSYGKSAKDVMTMYTKQRISYFAFDDFAVCELDMGDDFSYIFKIILPDEGVTPDDLLGRLSLEMLRSDFKREPGGLYTYSINLSLPRFSVSYKDDMLYYIETAGVPVNTVHYDNMSEGVVCVDVHHGLNMSLDEDGVIVHVESSIEGGETANFLKPGDDVYVNRPFIFMITEASSSSVLAMGVINDPSK